MASDGKWYPPRTPGKTAEPLDEVSTRWSRATPDGEPLEGATGIGAAESLAERAAIRAERAAMIAPAEPVSIKSVEVAELDPAIDLRDSAEPEPQEVDVGVSTHEVVSRANSNASSSAAPATSEVPSSGFASLSSVHSMGNTPKTVSMIPFDTEPEPENTEGGDSADVEEAPGLKVVPDSGRSAEIVPLQHAVLQEFTPVIPEPRRSSGFVLLALATVLALLSGVLGALWLRERSVVEDLRVDLEQSQVVEEVATDPGVDDDLNDEIRTLQLQNEELQTRLNEASALVLELPAGRLTEIVVPFTPIFADEENGRFIAMSEDGEYVVWADGADGAITDSGTIGGTPTGLFAAARKAWISTDVGRIEIVSLTNEEGLPAVEFGPTAFLAAEERAYWTYDTTSGDVVRLRKGDGGITAAVSVPSPVVDLTIGAGSLWALGEDGRVYRINTADFTVQGIDAGTDLISVTAGPDALWTLSAADGSLRRVDAVSGEVLVTVPVGRDPVDATFAGSSVWVALRSGTSLIEVDTRTSAVISRTALPGTPSALHQGDSGVFVTMEGDVPLVRVASLVPLPSEAEDAAEDAADAG